MLRRIALVLLLLLPALGWADRLPGHYPQRVMVQGSIDAVNFSALTVVIGDTLFYISPRTRVVTPGRREASRAEVQLGRRAGCNYQVDADGRYVLTEVWILPSGASFED